MASVAPSASSVVQRPSRVSNPAPGQLLDDRSTDRGPRRGCRGSRTCRAGPPAATSIGSIQSTTSSSSITSPVKTTRSASQPRQACRPPARRSPAEARSHVQVAELDDPQAVERAGSPGIATSHSHRRRRNDSLPGSRSSHAPCPSPISSSGPPSARSSSRTGASGEIPAGRRLRARASVETGQDHQAGDRARQPRNPSTARTMSTRGTCRCPQSSRADETPERARRARTGPGPAPPRDVPAR